jgi:hypothetical protein
VLASGGNLLLDARNINFLLGSCNSPFQFRYIIFMTVLQYHNGTLCEMFQQRNMVYCLYRKVIQCPNLEHAAQVVCYTMEVPMDRYFLLRLPCAVRQELYCEIDLIRKLD